MVNFPPEVVDMFLSYLPLSCRYTSDPPSEAKKVLKEKKEIEKEMHEATAEVDKDERASNVSGPRNTSNTNSRDADLASVIV